MPSDVQEYYAERLKRQRELEQGLAGNTVSRPTPVVTPEGGAPSVSMPNLPKEAPAPVPEVQTPEIPEAEQEEGLLDRISNAAHSVADTYNEVIETTGRRNVLNNFMNEWKQTNAYKKYMYNKADVLEEVKGISERTGIPINAILASPENLDNARDVDNYGRLQNDISGNEQFDLHKTFEKYPSLQKILDAKGDTEAAILLHHIKDVKATQGIIDAGITGLRRGLIERDIDKGIGWEKGFGEGITPEDEAEIQRLRNEYNELPEYRDPSDRLIEATVGMGMEQVPRQAFGFGRGLVRAAEGALGATVIGMAGQAIATARLPGLLQMVGTIASRAATEEGIKTAAKLGMGEGIFEDMFKETAGRYYLEYRDYTGKNGQKLTDEDAKLYAIIASGLETTIEFANMNIILNALAGVKSAGAKAAIRAIRGAKDDVTLQATLRTLLHNMGEVTISESLEEGAQEFTTGLVRNYVSIQHPEVEIPYTAFGDLLKASGEATVQAILPSMFFGATVGLGGSTRIVRNFARANMLQNEWYIGQLRNEQGRNMVANLREDLKDNKLYKTDKPLYTDTVKAELETTEFHTAYLDADTLADTEKGQELLDRIIENSSLTREEIEQQIDEGASISLPTEIYAQMGRELSDEDFNTLQDNVSFKSDTPSIAAIRKWNAETLAQVNAIREQEAEQVEKAVTDFVDTYVEDKGLRALAKEAIYANKDPIKGVQELRKAANEQLDVYYNPIIEQMKESAGRGDHLEIGDRTPDYAIGETPTGSQTATNMIRVSDNAQWYQDFYAENGRPPTNAQYREMAYDVLTGEGSAYGFTDEYWGGEQDNPEAIAMVQDVIDAVKSLQDRVDKLNEIEDIFKNTDMEQVKIATTLTPEGYQAYKDIEAQLSQSPVQEVREASRVGALIMAHRADTFAAAMRAAGHEYTATDYMKDKRIVVNGNFNPYVVFDDNSIENINRYQQAQEQLEKAQIAEATRMERDGASREEILNQTGWFRDNKGKWRTVRGQIVINGAERIINIFKTANWSTFVHELGHLCVTDLKELAEMENAPKWAVNDWNTVKEFVGYKEGQQGFTVAQQEKFAKAFEAYLREGKAPTNALRSAFRKLRQWLIDIYKSLTNLVEPSDAIRKVMDRMVATQEEIDNAYTMRQYDTFIKEGGLEVLTDKGKADLQDIVTQVKAEAAEKVQKEVRRRESAEYERQRQEFFDMMRAGVRDKLAHDPMYIVQQATKGMKTEADVKSALAALTKDNPITYEDYMKYRKENGLTLEDAVDKRMRAIIKDNPPLSDRELQGLVDKAMQGYGAELQRAMETDAMYRFARKQERLERMTKRKPKEPSNKVEEKSSDEKYKERSKEQMQGVRLVRDAGKGLRQRIYHAAVTRIASLPISEATDSGKWRNLARRANQEMTRHMAKREWTKAAQASQANMYYDMMSTLAATNREQVEKIAAGLKKRSQVMTKNNNVTVNERYTFNHFLYVFGMSAQNPEIPPETENSNGEMQPYSFQRIMLEMADKAENPYFNEDGVLDLPDWILNAATAQVQRDDGYRNLTVDEFKGLQELMNAIYKSGKEDKTLRTITKADGTKVQQNVALAEIIKEADGRMADIVVTDTTGAEDPSNVNKFARNVNRYFLRLTKPEVILRELGQSAVDFIYMPLKRATDLEGELAHNRETGWKSIWDNKIISLYTDAERKEMLDKLQYKLGTSNITKEKLLCLALNWGTELNKKRVVDGFHVTEQQVTELLKNLDSRDWKFVSEVWKLINSYWERTKEVEAAVTGVVLQKEQAVGFDIIDNNGELHHLEGGYYPIKYDRTNNLTLGERAEEDQLKNNRGGLTQLGMGKGFTKSRVQGTVDAQLDLHFSVISNSLIEVCHNIAFREAIRDVNSLVRSKQFRDLVTRKFGVDTQRMLRRWVLDSWCPAPKTNDSISRISRFLRVNATSATLGFRTMTALLNAGNVPPMFLYLAEADARRHGGESSMSRGMMRGITAFMDFYGDMTEIRNKRRMIMDKSIFMRDRVETMDRDMRQVLKETKYSNLTKHAFRMIEETDLMVGLPMWWAEYNAELAYGIQDGLTYEQAERAAIDAGDASVRRTIASGQAIDLSEIQRGTELEKCFTMYMSYMNTVLNALMWKYGESKRIRYQGGNRMKALMPIIDGLLLWIAGNAFLNGGVRWFFNGRDDDKDTEGFLKAWALECVGVGTGGLVYFKDLLNFSARLALGEKVYGSKGFPMQEVLLEGEKFISSIFNDDKSKADVLRHLARLLSYGKGYSQSIVDALITTAEWIDDDFDADFSEYMRAVIFDRRLKK